QLVDRIARVVVNGGRQLRDRRVPLPGGRNALLGGIGPVVGVVKVDQQAHPGVLHLLAERDGGIDGAPAVLLVVSVGCARIDEGAEADVIEAVRLHGREQVGARGGGLRFLIGDVSADVEAEGEGAAAAAGARGSARAAAAGRSTLAARARRAAAGAPGGSAPTARAAATRGAAARAAATRGAAAARGRATAATAAHAGAAARAAAARGAA